jgi:hypothetical protein
MNEESTPPLFRSPAGRALSPKSHISKNRHGKFVMKLTIPDPENPAFVGKRVTLQLRTRNPALAREKRDAVLEFAALAKLPTRNISLTFDEQEVGRFSSLESQAHDSNMTA